MSEIPSATLESMWTTLIAGNDVTMQACDGTHGYVSGTSTVLDDIAPGSFLGDPFVLTSTDFTGGVFSADPAALANILAGQFVEAVVIYADTGVATTSPILVFIDKNVDGTAMNKEGDGTDMSAYGPSNIIASI